MSPMRMISVFLLAFCVVVCPSILQAQKWTNPNFDAHRLDYRDLGYPAINQIAADNSPITALLAARNGRIYGATSGKQSYLFVYERTINKVRPLGKIADAAGVYHGLVQAADGKIYIGTGLNILGHVALTQDFPSGFRAIEEQLWKDIAAPYEHYKGGHIYCYDPESGDSRKCLPEDACPLKDLGIPVAGNSVYAMAIDAKGETIYGVSYPDAHFFIRELKSDKIRDLGPLLAQKVYSGPERTWRSVPRALCCTSDGLVYTTGDDGFIVYYDPVKNKIIRTTMRIPGEYWEAWNYYGYPVAEQFIVYDKRIYGATSDGFLFQMDPVNEQIANLGKPCVSRRVRAMVLGPDRRLYMICGEFEEPCKLCSYDLSGREGFYDWGILAVDRSPYYAKRAYQFDAMATGVDGTIFIGESDRRASLFLFLPGGRLFNGILNPDNPRFPTH
jgi:outer membrane protein assembly factor BamB